MVNVNGFQVWCLNAYLQHKTVRSNIALSVSPAPNLVIIILHEVNLKKTNFYMWEWTCSICHSVSLNIISSSFHFAANDKISFFFMSE